jgi:GABA(A) receptor-associated protein
MSSSTFIQTFQLIPVESRIQESTKIRRKYANRIPVIVDRGDKYSPIISKNKYIVPTEIPVMEFMQVIRKQIQLKPSEGIHMFILVQEGDKMNKIMPKMNDTMGMVYEQSKNNDGYLYIEYAIENTFGSK